jgi:hypothetical protein
MAFPLGLLGVALGSLIMPRVQLLQQCGGVAPVMDQRRQVDEVGRRVLGAQGRQLRLGRLALLQAVAPHIRKLQQPAPIGQDSCR